MSGEGVRAALTPEEWRDPVNAMAQRFRALSWDDESDAPAILLDGYLHREDYLAVAAALLSLAGPDGKPLFTRGMLAVLRDLSKDRREYWGYRQPEDDVADLALDRLESLLPPEEP